VLEQMLCPEDGGSVSKILLPICGTKECHPLKPQPESVIMKTSDTLQKVLI